MQNKEFRCHPSIIIANSLKIMVVVFFAVFSALVELPDSETIYSEAESTQLGAMVTLGIVFAVMLIYFIVRFFAWRKTYISLTDENFVYDKRTVFFQKKINVKLSQISTVNLQKGILDRFFSTYTVKLDINSSATAEKNDFHLVFKEDFAKEFEQMILSFKEKTDTTEQNAKSDLYKENEQEIIRFDTGRILLHSLFMTPIWSTLVFGASLAGVTVPFMELSPVFYPVLFLLGLPVALIASFLAMLVRNVFLYHDFTLIKKDNELIISFGLITKRIYKLPLSKTNAVLVRQSFFGRIFGMYYAEIINVGMGNEEDKLSPVLCLMLKKENLEQVLSQAIPDFYCKIEADKSPNKAFVPTFLKGVIPMSVLISAVIILGTILCDIKFTFVSCIILSLFWVIIAFCSYKAKGLATHSDKLLVATGVLSRRILIVPYSKIQILELKKGPVSSPLGLRNGSVSILSSLINRDNKIGYFAPEYFDIISQKIEQYESVDWSK